MAETTATTSLSCGGGRFRSNIQRRSSGTCLFSGFISSALIMGFSSLTSLESLESIIKHMAKSCSGEPSETELAGSGDSLELLLLLFVCFFPDSDEFSNTLFLLLVFFLFFLETSALPCLRTGSTDSGSVSVSLL
ncbi:hypothetical protein BRARA_C04517 [Brassica rapa]|uniref:Uncharacterized protein n=1 Tax=Brassica campestris TaxID=3711 RepID=A0A398ABJ6_BRACM|nr:hypothetical protein BRARA_C04517 [Brassica rapa]